MCSYKLCQQHVIISPIFPCSWTLSLLVPSIFVLFMLSSLQSSWFLISFIFTYNVLYGFLVAYCYVVIFTRRCTLLTLIPLRSWPTSCHTSKKGRNQFVILHIFSMWSVYFSLKIIHDISLSAIQTTNLL